MNIGALFGLTKLIPGKWLLIGGLVMSAATGAWAAHSWTKASWSAHFNSYRHQVAMDVIETLEESSKIYRAQMAKREARIQQYQAEIRAVRGDLEAAQGETRVVYREIPITDAGECRLTDDGVQLLQRAAAAANRAAGVYAGAGDAGGGHGERAGVSGPADGPGPT